MSDDNDVRPLLVEIRDIVLRHEEVNRKDAEFRKRVLFALLLALAAAVAAMGYGLMLVHATIKEIKHRQEQQHPEKVADTGRGNTGKRPRMAWQYHGCLHNPSSIFLPSDFFALASDCKEDRKFEQELTETHA